MELLLTCFSECRYFFLRYLTISAMVKQNTMKIKAEPLIVENEKGIALNFAVKLTHF